MILKFKNHTVTILDNKVDFSPLKNCLDAKLVYICGKGRLTTHFTRSDSMTENYIYNQTITLNNIPLIHINDTGCPTCENILTAGYGINKSNTFSGISDNINDDFINLEHSIKSLKPLLELLDSGFYIIADMICYPTDGNGNFFWNTPNTPTHNPATAEILLSEWDYACAYGQPVYLYPTQNTDCYNEERVKYYIEKFKNTNSPPRAIAYNFGEFINFIIDGHHKACAAALLHKPVNCITIIPATGWIHNKETVYYKFGDIRINSETIPKKYLIPKEHIFNRNTSTKHTTWEQKYPFHRNWEDDYIKSAKSYPSAVEYAKIAVCEVFDISEDVIEKAFSANDDIKLEQILILMMLNKDNRLKQTSLRCADFPIPNSLSAERAFKILLQFKNDKEVEDFFIDYIVKHSDDKHNVFLELAHSYWDKGGIDM